MSIRKKKILKDICEKKKKFSKKAYGKVGLCRKTLEKNLHLGYNRSIAYNTIANR